MNEHEQTEIEAALELKEVEISVKMEKDLIIVEQLPIIRQTLEVMSAEIDKKTADALALICTEDTVKTVKAVRAELNKEFTELEDKRKTVKKAVLSPYEEFEAIYKELVSDKFKSADSKLKIKIDEVESGLKLEKEKDCMRYFAELCAAEHIDFVAFEKIGLSITLGATLTALKKQIAVFIDKVNSDLKLIDTQEHSTEILVEYRKSLNVSKSIVDVTTRHKELEEQKAREIERNASRIAQNERIAKVDTFLPPPVQAPVTVTSAVTAPPQGNGKEYTATFKVWGTIEVLKGLKSYLAENGIRFENVQAVPPAPVVAKESFIEKRIEKPPEEKKGSQSVAFLMFKAKEGGFGGREYSYIIPEELTEVIVPGVLADVSTSKGVVSAFVNRLGTTADITADILPKLKAVEGLTKKEEVN